MKIIYTFLLLLLVSSGLQAQIFPPANCFNNDYQLELSVSGNQSTCNDSFFLSTSYTGSPLIYWTDGYIGDSRWITYPGVFQAFAFDSLGCSDTTEQIYVDVNISVAYAASASFQYSFCDGDSLQLYGSANGIPQWNNGQTGSTVYATATGTYFFTATDPNGCSVTSNSIQVTEIARPQVTLSVTGDTSICSGSSILISAASPTAIYWLGGWSSGNTFSANYSGDFYAYSYDQTGQCIGYSDTLSLTILEPYLDNLCYVSVDSASGKNQLNWFNTPAQRTVSYNLYRESNVFGSYTLMANVPFGTTSYIDMSSIPEQQPYRYYIAAIDSCGNENINAYSYIHGTIHLTSSLGVNGQNNLTWTPYFGNFQVLTYDIYRSNNFGPFVQISSISASFSSFSDLAPPAGNNRYFVGIQYPSCGTIPGSLARSNIVSNQATTGIGELANTSISIVGNPSDGIFTIQGLPSGQLLRIFNMQGQLVYQSVITENAQLLDIRSLDRGIYFLQAGTATRKILR